MSQANHLAIVGKEPLADQESAAITSYLVEKCSAAGKSVSLITNGLGLHFLSDTVLQKLAYIDVSFDGGPETYGMYRRSSWQKLAKNVHRLFNKGIVRMNALHVINDTTIHNLSDMLRVDELGPFERIVFSPYLATKNFGANSVKPVSLTTLLRMIAATPQFLAKENTTLLLDDIHFSQTAENKQAVIAAARELEILNKIRIVDGDPLDFGIIRATYDGYLLTPLDSLNTFEYASVGSHVPDWGKDDDILGQFFQRCLDEKKRAIHAH
jgi:hypothetical protein